MGRKLHASGTIFPCADCSMILTIRSTGLGAMFDGHNHEWFMVKDNVWARGQRGGKCRFLCVGCLERRIGRKLSSDDFKRSAKVNFVDQTSAKLRRRMRGLKPAKRLVETTFKP
jgi:hypothetical protein